MADKVQLDAPAFARRLGLLYAGWQARPRHDAGGLLAGFRLRVATIVRWMW